jgi:hypothetical protein
MLLFGLGLVDRVFEALGFVAEFVGCFQEFLRIHLQVGTLLEQGDDLTPKFIVRLCCNAETMRTPMTAMIATASQNACPATTEKMSHPATPPTIPPSRRTRQARSRSFQSPTQR